MTLFLAIEVVILAQSLNTFIIPPPHIIGLYKRINYTSSFSTSSGFCNGSPLKELNNLILHFQIIIEAIEEPQHQRQKDRPHALHVQASRILCANYRSLETGSKADLAKCLESFQDSPLFFGTDFPNLSSDIPVVCDKMIQHATGKNSFLESNW